MSEDGKPSQKVTDLPEWAQTLITNLRSESADRRVENNKLGSTIESLEADLSKKSEELSARTQEAQDEKLELAKLTAAIQAGVPRKHLIEFASLLKGKTPEELTEHAEKTKGMFGSSDESNKSAHDPTQNWGNQSNQAAGTPQTDFGRWISEQAGWNNNQD